MGNCNSFADFVLLAWVPFGLICSRMMPVRRAFFVIVLGGILFLPQRTAFDFPMVPPIDKTAIVFITALIGCWLLAPRTERVPQVTSAAKWLFAMLALSALLTTLTNLDAVNLGGTRKQGLSLYDAVSGVSLFGLETALPFFLGQALFRRPEHLRELLIALVVAALIYTPFVLYEARMSPQFHRMVYGCFQHDWKQMIRGDGFRAIVFLNHGLTVALFLSQALIALATVRDPKPRFPVPRILVWLLLAGALASCRSMASVLYALLAVPLILWGSTKVRLNLARVMAIFVLAYPILRSYDLVPTQWLLDRVSSLSEERALSLQFRFDNETLLLDHARERLWFGWGGYGRNRVFDSRGNNITVIDGEWIREVGIGGLMLFATTFGALMYPVFRAARRAKLFPRPDAELLSCAALLLAVLGLDLIPNGLSHPLPLLLAGALTATCVRAPSGQSHQRAPELAA